jgi:hypothetical protein
MSRCFCCYKPVKSNVGQLYCPSNKASKTFRYLLTDPLSKIAQIWEQTFPASDPVAIDFERSGDSSGRDSAVEPDQSGRMRQQSGEKTPGVASIALPREQRPACGAIVDATLMTCASALWQDRDMALA